MDFLIIISLAIVGVILLNIFIKMSPKNNDSGDELQKIKKLKEPINPTVKRPQVYRPVIIDKPRSIVDDLKDMADEMDELCKCKCQKIVDNEDIMYDKPPYLRFIRQTDYYIALYKCAFCGRTLQIHRLEGQAFSPGDGWIPKDYNFENF